MGRPPKREDAAHYWLAASEEHLPDAVARVLASHADFHLVTAWTAEPEVKLPFDKRRGEPRNTDLLIQETDTGGAFLIAVEAKADEAFGETVDEAYDNAVKRRTTNPRSKEVGRADDLVASLFGTTVREDPIIGDRRYQLLTATTGALAVASRMGLARVISLVQEFVTVKTTAGAIRLTNAFY